MRTGARPRVAFHSRAIGGSVAAGEVSVVLPLLVGISEDIVSMVDNTERLVRSAGTIRVLFERYITSLISLISGAVDH